MVASAKAATVSLCDRPQCALPYFAVVSATADGMSYRMTCLRTELNSEDDEQRKAVLGQMVVRDPFPDPPAVTQKRNLAQESQPFGVEYVGTSAYMATDKQGRVASPALLASAAVRAHILS